MADAIARAISSVHSLRYHTHTRRGNAVHARGQETPLKSGYKQFLTVLRARILRSVRGRGLNLSLFNSNDWVAIHIYTD
jgi:hypothetical protein